LTLILHQLFHADTAVRSNFAERDLSFFQHLDQRGPRHIE
jgi:hypothetical protein